MMTPSKEDHRSLGFQISNLDAVDTIDVAPESVD